MINESKNKGVGTSPDQPTSIRAVSVIKNEYHFPGGGVWRPMNIVASTREEAEKIYLDKREPVDAPAEEAATAPSSEKVEETKVNES